MRLLTHRHLLCGLLLCSLLFSLAPAFAARATKAQLNRRKASIQTKMSQIRRLLDRTNKKVRIKRRQLNGVQHEVRLASRQYQVATLRYQRAKQELRYANRALRSARNEFTETQQEAGERLVAAYQRGDRGYLDYLLSSNDFDVLLDRAQLADLMRSQDRQTLSDLQQRKIKLARYQDRVQDKTREVANWQHQVAILKQRRQAEHYIVSADLSRLQRERARYEAEYAELMRNSREITAMIRRMQSTPEGRRRYNKTYAGGVGGLPVAGRITSRFGWRTHPIFKTRRMHTGVDIAAPSGTPVGAGGGGEVIFAGRRGGYGNAIIIDHGHGKTTLYGHLSRINVHVGQVVTRRQVIGRVGSTGFSTGPHLHYEVRINGSPVNPL